MEPIEKNYSNEDLKFTIITVSYNCGDTIAKTMQSVLSQTHRNIEYIIIDGCSTDNTHAVIHTHMDPRVHLVVEKDEGIYDAMNKGFAHATGDVVSFLNSGDYLFNQTTLAKISSVFLSENDIDGVYGDIMYYGDGTQRLMRMNRDTPFHVITRFLCHQALFVKRSSFFNIKPFNLQYRVYADYDWILDGLCNYNYNLLHLDLPVVYYQEGGFSQQTIGQYAYERLQIMKKYIGQSVEIKTFYQYPGEIIYFILVYFYLVFHHGIYRVKIYLCDFIF